MTEHPTCHMCEHWESGVCHYHSKRVPGSCRACIYGHARPEYRTPAPKRYKRVKLPAVYQVSQPPKSVPKARARAKTQAAAPVAPLKQPGKPGRPRSVEIDTTTLRKHIYAAWPTVADFERAIGFPLHHELTRKRISAERLNAVCAALSCQPSEFVRGR